MLTDSPVLLAVTMWQTWPLIGPPADRELTPEAVAPCIRLVSPAAVGRIAARFAFGRATMANSDHVHQLVRVNVCNIGNEPIVLHAFALNRTAGATLPCELVPSVTLRPGARHPICAEVVSGLIAAAIELDVERADGSRRWARAQTLGAL
jgi:hypothetical protein